MASLHYVWGSMNSSKSAQLLMTWHNYEEQGYRVLVVKPKIDTRDGEYIKSRALDVRRKADIVIGKDDIGLIYAIGLDYDVILIDESQFLTKEQVNELGDIVDFLNIPIMAYGLKTDYFGQLFEGSKRLIEIADKFQEIKTVCPCCGGKAIFNMRIDEETKEPVFGGEQISVGFNYQPVCRKYYNELKEKCTNK
ncbi:MAG: thymidine kinase [Psychrobacillus sp.]